MSTEPGHQPLPIARRAQCAARRLVLGCVLLATALAPELGAAEPVETATFRSDESFRGAFSRKMAPHANDNDVSSALLAYAAIISKSQRLHAAPDQLIYRDSAELIQALRAGTVDIAVGTAEEILLLPDGLVEPPYVVSFVGGEAGVEYLLLVRQDSPIQSPADLDGKKLNLLDNALGNLALRWLRTLHPAQPEAKPFVPIVKTCIKPVLAALPVYFRQAEACIITAASYTLLCELNPQMRTQLRVLARSPRYFPLVACFRRNIDPRHKREIERAVTRIDSTPAGRQMLTLYQVDRMEFCDPEVLEDTRELLRDQPAAPAAPTP